MYCIFFRFSRFIVTEFLDLVLGSALKTRNPRDVAVLGCATGGGLHLFEGSSTKVTAVDLNPWFLSTTRERYAHRIANLDLVEADLNSQRPEIGPFDLIFAGLIFEYVDPTFLLKSIDGWLASDGVLTIVLQLDVPAKPISDSGYESLKQLKLLMTLHSSDKFCQLAKSFNLQVTESSIDRLESGKEFFVGHFQRRVES